MDFGVYALEYLINLVRDRLDAKKYAGVKDRPQRLGYLRALAINTLIHEAAELFFEHEAALLNSAFPHTLLEKSKYKAQIDDIIALSVANIYKAPEVIEKEIIGYKVLRTLLQTLYLQPIAVSQQGHRIRSYGFRHPSSRSSINHRFLLRNPSKCHLL